MSSDNLLVNNDIINYDALLKTFPWLDEENQQVIISPDIDGLLCGLFMSSHYNWNIAGYYDGKKLAIRDDSNPKDCIFLDMEIYRPEIKSCGQHMVLYNKKRPPLNWDNFKNCFNPNVIRGFDAYNNFQQKYPLATIHLLLCVAKSHKNISIPRSATTILLYVDGTFKNLLNYPENCTSWLKFLRVKDKDNPIYSIFLPFANQSISSMMHDLQGIFQKFKEINNGKRGGDKIKIDNIVQNSFSKEEKTKSEELLKMLSNATEWQYKPEKWASNKLNVFAYNKGTEEVLNNKNYNVVLEKTPVSFAITATKRMEYTLEQPDKF